MFLHYILHCNEDEMIKKVLRTQQKYPAKGDWCLVVQEDLQEFDLDHISWEEIENMSKQNFKSIVKEAMTKVAFQYLIEEKEKMSKMKNVEYSELKLQSYLTCADTSIKQKQLLYMFRNRMFKCADNLGDKTTKCRWCLTAADQQQHYWECEVIKAECPELAANIDNAVYADLFSNDDEIS